MFGATANDTLLLASPCTATVTLPVLAPAGSGTMICELLQLVGVPTVPLKETVLVPCVAPKLDPVITTEVPAAPEVGDRLLMLGATANDTPLLASPLTATVTLPVLAPVGSGRMICELLQLVGVPTVPLKETMLVPCLAPKLDPVITTEAPAAPEMGD